jgi:Tol biopolymer transport system component
MRATSWHQGCGNLILFESEQAGKSEIMRMSEDGADRMRLVAGTTWSPTCSPDMKFVYYAEVTQPRWKIRRVPIDGGAPIDVVDNPGDTIPGNVTISPDGELIAFP